MKEPTKTQLRDRASVDLDDQALVGLYRTMTLSRGLDDRDYVCSLTQMDEIEATL